MPEARIKCLDGLFPRLINHLPYIDCPYSQLYNNKKKSFTSFRYNFVHQCFPYMETKLRKCHHYFDLLPQKKKSNLNFLYIYFKHYQFFFLFSFTHNLRLNNGRYLRLPNLIRKNDSYFLLHITGSWHKIIL